MLEKRLRETGQNHIARLLEDRVPFLSRKRIEEDIALVDFPLIEQLVNGNCLYEEPPKKEVAPAEVIPASFAASPGANTYRTRGEDLLRQGRVAALVVAGGQGSRLGIEAPKGVVEVSPVSAKSLFCLHAQKVLALSRKYGSTIPLFIMTSRINDAQSRAFFAEHAYFGLDPDEVHFFVQGMLPSVTPEGKFLISREGGLFMNPDGHGGTFLALQKNGCLETMREKGIEEIFYFQVDNPLVKVCDPLFIGLHHESGARMSSKVVRKRGFEEKVGVIARVDGKTRVIEYSDMGDEIRYAADEGGAMLHWAGSIAIHVIRRDFVETLTRGDLRLSFHKALKTIPTLDEKGNPAEEKGIKFETFIFDALPLADTSITLEVLREEEFAPVKNMTGEDSLESSRSMQSDLYRSWLEELGVRLKPTTLVEISPLFALDRQEMHARMAGLPREIETDLYLPGLDEEP